MIVRATCSSSSDGDFPPEFNLEVSEMVGRQPQRPADRSGNVVRDLIAQEKLVATAGL
jgi:hypothetical protein